MNTTIRIAKVTCEVYKSLAPLAIASLRKQNIEHVHAHSRRAVVLREQSTFSFLPTITGLDEDPAEVLEFYLPWSQAEQVLKTVVREVNLSAPGRGSIYAEEVQLRNPEGVDFINSNVTLSGDAQPELILTELASINCVVQRGQGNEIARHALEAGTNVPAISFGLGTGLRNKLGLIRVTIPAEKELVNVIVHAQDRDEIMNALIQAGRLDQPGNGFIGASPVGFGVLNPKTFRGKQRYSASMEQVITAIDQLKTGTEWRKKTVSLQRSDVYLKKSFLHDLLNMTLICNEGKSSDIVNAAISAGAGGATISKIKYSTMTASKHAVSPAREAISMGVSPKSVEAIIHAIEAAGAFGSDTACIVETKPLPLACTYLGK